MRLRTLVVATGVFAGASIGAGEPARAARTETIHVLWRDPGSIEQRDLLWGAGSPQRAPKAPFTFIEENLSGTKPKIDVTDAAGVRWTVKLATVEPKSNEVHAEIAASRIVWALGYFVDENYFVRAGQITGATNLKRAAELVTAEGMFRLARFERKPDGAKRAGEWDIEDNRFKGTRELSGLHGLMMLLANWDLLPANTAMFRVPLSNGDTEQRYVVTDLGSTFGRMRGGVREAPSRWNLEDYSESSFLGGVVQRRLEFRNPLMGRAPLAIPVDHARWFANLASRLSERQIRQAFEASGASHDEIAAFSNQVTQRIAALQAAVAK